jgi:nucleotide-binding universal stress UspA family protein
MTEEAKLGKPLFQNIFVPISSEFYPPAVFQVSALLARASHGTVTSVYVYEKRIFDEVERVSDTFLSHYDMDKTEQELREEHLRQAEHIAFEDATAFFRKRDIPLQTSVVEGTFLEIVKQEITRHQYDLVVMGFEKERYFDYRLLSEIPIPLWIEAGKGKNSILAVCSNLAPNKKVPPVSMQLSELLGWTLHMMYIIDTEDAIEVDETGVRMEQKTLSELQRKALDFITLMKQKGVEVQLVQGSFERETLKEANRLQAGVVVIGREQKQQGMLGLPVKDSKRKLLRHCKCSLLFLN